MDTAVSLAGVAVQLSFKRLDCAGGDFVSRRLSGRNKAKYRVRKIAGSGQEFAFPVAVPKGWNFAGNDPVRGSVPAGAMPLTGDDGELKF